MAKSKIVKATEQIANTVSDGFKKIEDGVVDGYKKIEQGVVDGYTKIEDKFVVGCGMDYQQRYRNLPYIGVVELGE